MKINANVACVCFFVPIIFLVSFSFTSFHNPFYLSLVYVFSPNDCQHSICKCRPIVFDRKQQTAAPTLTHSLTQQMQMCEKSTLNTCTCCFRTDHKFNSIQKWKVIELNPNPKRYSVIFAYTIRIVYMEIGTAVSETRTNRHQLINENGHMKTARNSV